MSLRLRLLGGCWCARGEEPLRGFISQKARALLVYLAMEAGEHARPELAALLWSEMPEASARTNLRQVLANLRRLLGDDLAVTRYTAALAPTQGLDLDVARFLAEAAAFHEEDDLAAGERAAARYRGDFLVGFHVGDAAGFETWMTVQRERLHEQAARLFYRLAARYEAQGRYEQALVAVDRLLALEPWREEAHRQRMTLLARLGRYGAALRQYETCRRILQKELKVAPGPDTLALYHKVRALQRRPPRRMLPPQPHPFVGREKELARLIPLLLAPEQRLITLVGMGGVGKTRLALEAAQRTQAAFLDGVTFLPLAPLADPGSLPQALAQALDLTPRAGDDLAAQIGEHLRDQERLILLDNFEHLLPPGPGSNPALDAISIILARAPQITLLITSQQPLRLRWERRFPLAGMAYARSGDASADQDAERLFLSLARRVAPDIALDGETRRAVQRICQLVEGLPLALTLAAGWAAQAPLPRIAADLEGAMAALASAWRDGPARHRSLRAVFDHAWRLLSPQERAILPGLGLFPGGVSAAAAGAVVGATPAQLAGLAERSLLQAQGADRWIMHGTLRAYLLERLRLSGRGPRLRQRYVDFFRELAQTQTAEPRPPDWVARLQAEDANLEAALAFARDAGWHERGLALAAALWRYWDATGAWAGGRAWLETFLARASERDPALRGRALSAAGVLAWRLADFDAARAHHHAALNLARAQDDPQGQARALANLALVALDEGRLTTAMGRYQESLTIFRALEDASNMALALNNMGIIALHQRDFPLAQRYFQESLDLYRHLGQPRGVSWALGNLGNAARYQGQHQEAVRLYEEALALQRDLGDRYGEAVSLGNLGHALALQGYIERAIPLYQQAWQFFEEMESAADMAETLDRLAAARAALGELEEASRLLDRAEALRDRHRLAIHPLEKTYRDAVMDQVRAKPTSMGEHRRTTIL